MKETCTIQVPSISLNECLEVRKIFENLLSCRYFLWKTCKFLSSCASKKLSLPIFSPGKLTEVDMKNTMVGVRYRRKGHKFGVRRPRLMSPLTNWANYLIFWTAFPPWEPRGYHDFPSITYIQVKEDKSAWWSVEDFSGTSGVWAN